MSLRYPPWWEGDGPVVVWGGLLHDLGKVFQRMGGSFQGIGHARAGAVFLQKACLWLPPEALHAVEAHHGPDTPTARLVALADRLSAGERFTAPQQEEQEARLLSPFAWVGHKGPPHAVGRQPEARYFPLRPLDSDTGSLFPGPGGGGNLGTEYRSLAQGLAREAKALGALDQEPGPRLETWLALLQRWVWCVPAAVWRAVPDTSLYEHLRTTAALACALWQWTEARPGDRAKVEDLLERGEGSRFLDEPVAGLLHGDLSGLQDFLYRISSRGALRGLKGRSFYLQALCDAVARWVLDRLGLPLCNLLYSGGGHFFVLTPRPDLVPLDDLRRRVSERLFALHGPDLYLALGLVPLTPRHLWDPKAFAQAWLAAGRATREEKERRFAHLTPAHLAAGVFEPHPAETGDPARACQGCRRESPNLDPETGLCPFCRSLQDLGAALRRPDFLLLERVQEQQANGPPFPRPWEKALEAFGLRPRLLGAEEADHLPAGVTGSLLALGRPQVLAEAGHWLRGRPNLALGYVTYATATPVASDGGVMEFGEMAERARGVPALGVVRMDVDDLSRLFTEGGPPGSPPPSLGRVATLSFLLRLFFEMEVARLCQAHNEKGEEKAYLIYSGGDDLFLVASWSAAPFLAREVRERMRDFFGPSITASAGVLVDSPDAPLYHLASEARAYLERAKSWERDGRSKDAVTFLDPEQAAEWSELAEAGDWARQLAAEVECGRLPRGLLILLQQIGHLARKERVRGKPTYRWHWLAAYHLARLRERQNGRRPPSPVLDTLWKDLVEHGRPQAAHRWALIARWAELLTRSRPQGGGG